MDKRGSRGRSSLPQPFLMTATLHLSDLPEHDVQCRYIERIHCVHAAASQPPNANERRDVTISSIPETTTRGLIRLVSIIFPMHVARSSRTPHTLEITDRRLLADPVRLTCITCTILCIYMH